jgi:hypothetical protein
MTRPRSVHDIQDAENSTINMLIYGHPGVGKTPFWGTGGPRLLIMDSDNGYESAIASGSKAKRAPATSYDEVDELYEWVKHEGFKELDWIVWDSLTLFQDRTLIDDLVEDAHAQNPNQSRWIPSKREYFIDHNRIGDLVRRFVSLPVNFGISCHVMIDTDPDGQTLWMPAVQGNSGKVSMASKVSGYMNIIGLLGNATAGREGHERKVKRILFQQEGKLFARDRFGVLGHHIDNPTVLMITQLIEERRGTVPPATPPRRSRRRRTTTGS